MTEPDTKLIGRLLRETQGEMRTVRNENARIVQQITDVFTLLSNRLATFEARIESRLDQTERSIEERLDRIETLLAK